MSATIIARHEQGDRFRVDIRGHTLRVDQPHEPGEAGPSPVELFVASLAGCAAFFATRFLRRHGVEDGRVRVTATYVLAHERPSRVTAVDLTLLVPAGTPAALVAAARRAAEECTVRRSLDPELVVDVSTAVEEPFMVVG